MLIPVNRIEGLTRAVVAPVPRSSLIAGQGAVIHLGGPGDYLVQARPWPCSACWARAARSLAGGSRGAALLRLREALQDARDYDENRQSFERGERRDYALSRLDLEALQPVVRGELPLVLAVNRASDIQTVLRIAKEEKLKMILAGAAKAGRSRRTSPRPRCRS